MILRFRTVRSCFLTNAPEGPGEVSKGRAPGQSGAPPCAAPRLAGRGCRGQRGPRSGLGAVKQVVFQELLFLFRKSVRAGKSVTDGGKDGECQRKAPQPPGQRRGQRPPQPRARPPAPPSRPRPKGASGQRPEAGRTLLLTYHKQLPYVFSLRFKIRKKL